MLWLVIVVLVLMIPLMAILLDSPLGRALAGRVEGNRIAPGTDPAVTKRVAQMESEIDRLSKEVSRLDEETTFLHKLLEKKPAANELPPGEHT